MTSIGKKLGEHIWLGYQKKYPLEKQTMYNVYTNVPAMIQPYQRDEFENCAGKQKGWNFFSLKNNQANKFLVQLIHQFINHIRSLMSNVINEIDKLKVPIFPFALFLKIMLERICEPLEDTN